MTNKSFATIPEAINEFKKGKMIIVIDNPLRENQADIIFPAETVTPEKINFLIKECGGLICAPLTFQRSQNLNLPPMLPPEKNQEKLGCNFSVTVDAKTVKSYGISASDRAFTIKILANSKTKPHDLLRPGHIFPLIAKDGGVLERNGHTEAAVDLCLLSNFKPVGVLCEILGRDGEIANFQELKIFAQKFNLKIICIDDLIVYLQKHPLKKIAKEDKLTENAKTKLITSFGEFQIRIYQSGLDNKEHLALTMGKINPEDEVLVRIHSQCLTGDTFFSLKCDCGPQLKKSFKIISTHKKGVLIYLNQEGRGIGLTNKIKSYALQEKGFDTVEANCHLGLPIDSRDYKIAALILKNLNIKNIKLLTNNPQKIQQIKKYGIKITQRIGLESRPQKNDREYLKTKKNKLGHLLTNV